MPFVRDGARTGKAGVVHYEFLIHLTRDRIGARICGSRSRPMNGKSGCLRWLWAKSKRLRGIFAPLLVPLDERDQINEPELRRFVSWLIERGVHGLYPNGSTGEFTRFTPEERRRIVRWWRMMRRPGTYTGRRS